MLSERVNRANKPCEKCNEPVLEVTAFGDDRRTYLVRCSCPKPCCFLCELPLDDEGRCRTMFCPLDGLPVPIPVLL